MTEGSVRRPRMSVVMPNYNHGHLIEQALVAISRQTMLPLEVVVVDDGSTDDSVTRLQSLAADMPWLKIHRHSENRGVNVAANTGLKVVSGEFVLVSAADDRLSAEMVERAFAAAAAFPQTGIVFSDHAEMSLDEATTRVAPLDLPQARRYFSGDEFIRLMQSNFFYFHVSNVWFNAALLRHLGGFPPEVRWHGDLLAAYAAAFEAGAVYAPGAVSYVRVSPSSYGAAGKRSDALRHRRAAAREVDERVRERVDERVEVEQRFDVGAGENLHEWLRWRHCHATRSRAPSDARTQGGLVAAVLRARLRTRQRAA